MTAINHRICHGIQNKRIVPESGGPLYPLCWSKAATTTLSGRNSLWCFPFLFLFDRRSETHILYLFTYSLSFGSMRKPHGITGWHEHQVRLPSQVSQAKIDKMCTKIKIFSTIACLVIQPRESHVILASQACAWNAHEESKGKKKDKQATVENIFVL